MQRYKCTVEYNGRPYHGWQFQEEVISVQQVFETALEKFIGEFVRVYVSGRTDAGVHAFGQVVHFDLPRTYPADAVMNAINHHLKPDPVAVIDCVEADENFHARFSSKKRYYMYRIINRRAPLTVDAGLAWGIFKPLDIDAMNEAAAHLIGTHDFTTFRASECQAKSPVKTLEKLVVTRGDHDPLDIRVYTESRSFLHHQVRNMVGTLVLVGKGNWKPIDVKTALEACDRKAGGPTAPADGLYFVKVDY
ncbi:pseudouridine synthase [Thalassospira lucentensis]|uniref:tRNA pseudouridine synthase A n=1 Tax=Thalassospira lucentensis TaxID=168935 RepID=A0A154L8W9_9PROT|nr:MULTISPECIES: tRNA pseudouridine(38-40) synthase TruA [Thalassospira]KZB67004.1 pseudouridine synthase [Thalassospira lucentensis]MCH2273201.1 tRNA pseudouridine(38-40) synthase TruA [Thalassospira sp.]